MGLMVPRKERERIMEMIGIEKGACSHTSDLCASYSHADQHRFVVEKADSSHGGERNPNLLVLESEVDRGSKANVV